MSSEYIVIRNEDFDTFIKKVEIYIKRNNVICAGGMTTYPLPDGKVMFCQTLVPKQSTPYRDPHCGGY